MTNERFTIFTTEDWQEITKRLVLSQRKADVLQQIFQAKPNSEIATTLSISVPTLRTHLRRLYQQLGVENRLELVLWVVADAKRNQVL